MPVKKIVEVCHKHGKVVFVDAAHIPGQIEVDIVDLDADFYAGNLHKWVFCPRSSAFIWRNPNRPHAWFKPLVTSAFEHSGIHEAFAYEGTKDDIPYLCAVDGINFLRRLGGVV
ncbi:LCYD2-like protein [Mya arenaria]|uniref:LCYD2-like protein n=1 Tax=Mya arenaria TaxID=6604 RepID=A0ABY7GBV2_MYAAR|nr:LCYD2-like protein [Mya arenaria]